jgi:transposase
MGRKRNPDSGGRPKALTAPQEKAMYLFCQNGGSKYAAARKWKVSKTTVYRTIAKVEKLQGKDKT